MIDMKLVQQQYDGLQGFHDSLSSSLSVLMSLEDLDLSGVAADGPEGPVDLNDCWLALVAMHLELMTELVDYLSRAGLREVK